MIKYGGHCGTYLLKILKNKKNPKKCALHTLSQFLLSAFVATLCSKRCYAIFVVAHFLRDQTSTWRQRSSENSIAPQK